MLESCWVCLWLNLPMTHHGFDVLSGTEPVMDAFVDCYAVVAHCLLWLHCWRCLAGPWTGSCGI